MLHGIVDRGAQDPPQALLTPTSKITGLDGRKMNKSYGNGIDLREAPAAVEQKIAACRITDRAHATDPGPMFTLHQVYSKRRDQGIGASGLHHRRHRLPCPATASD